MTRLLRVCIALLEDQNIISRHLYQAAYNHLKLQFQVI